SSITERASSRVMPPRSASSVASASIRSAVSATAPTVARASFSTKSLEGPLSRSAMRPRPPTLPPAFALRRACLGRRTVTGHRGNDPRLGLRLGNGHLRGGYRCLWSADRAHSLLDDLARDPPPELRLPLLPHRQQRSGDEDRRVRTGRDADEQCEREV